MKKGDKPTQEYKEKCNLSLVKLETIFLKDLSMAIKSYWLDMLFDSNIEPEILQGVVDDFAKNSDTQWMPSLNVVINKCRYKKNSIVLKQKRIDEAEEPININGTKVMRLIAKVGIKSITTKEFYKEMVAMDLKERAIDVLKQMAEKTRERKEAAVNVKSKDTL